MNLRLRLRLLLIALVCVLSGLLPRPSLAQTGDALLIRPFGDSITYGWGYADGTFCPVYNVSQTWCTSPLAIGGGYRGWMTWMALNLRAITFRTEGLQNGGSYNQQWITGSQAHDGYPGFRTDQLMLASRLPSFAGVTLVHAGTNDIAQGVDPGVAAANLFTLVSNLQAANSATRIVLAKIIAFAKPPAVCPYGPGNCRDYTPLNPKIDQFNQLIDQKWAQLPAAARQRVTLVDMHAVLSSGDFYFDGVHPNVLGYMQMACAWVSVIRGLPLNTGNACAPFMPSTPPMPPIPPSMMVPPPFPWGMPPSSR